MTRSPAKRAAQVRLRIAEQVGDEGKVYTRLKDDVYTYHIKCRRCWEIPPSPDDGAGEHVVISATTGEEASYRWRDHARGHGEPS